MAKLRIAGKQIIKKQNSMAECHDDLPLSFKSAPGRNVERTSN